MAGNAGTVHDAPRRSRPPRPMLGRDFRARVPKIGLIPISHNHYDHCSSPIAACRGWPSCKSRPTDGAITLDLLPGTDAAALLLDRKRERPRAELPMVLAEKLPQRLAHALASAEPGARMANLPDRILRALVGRLAAWHITPTGIEGSAKAEVTAGGIDTRDLSSRTMEAVRVPGFSSSARLWT